MNWFRMTGAALTLGIALAVLAGCTCGCTGGADGSDEPVADAVGGEVPMWAKLVPQSKDGRLQFVGGASFAESPEAGIDAAATEARAQIGVAARKRFTDLFNSGVQKSGIETTAIERLDYKNRVSSEYADRMEEAARQDNTYYRFCGGDAPAPDGAAGRPVCMIFVLMSIAETDWDEGLVEIFEAEGRHREEEGQHGLADLTEWYIRSLLEGAAQEGREHQR